ncbi:TPA: hypothetical protein CPT81_00520 [Candidatus Gastranaerophilales bacterium HUM_20]|nr:dihydrolipoyl dehydrogenase [Clostridium sp. CAG:729]DAB24862.1 MAG TPA: hypothetical protein CPT81_00520 [Candidatus Gastranaerophilales bacterium HUM_20]
MNENTYDLGIIGGGPAGYTAALHAKASGLSVVMFEKDKVGGVCLNRGCIPTKAILHSAEVYEDLKCSSDIGINCEGLSVDFAKVVERKERTVEKLRKSLELTLKNAGVVTVIARAEVAGENKIKANGELYECSKIIVATGSSPRALKGIEFDNEFVLSSDDVLNLTSLPKSIAIIGSGAIGIEWARIFSAFDVEVTIIEAAEHLLPLADTEVSKRVERIFKSKKIKMYLSNGVQKIEDKKVYLSSGDIIEPECVLLAVGRKPDIDKKTDNVTYLGDVYGSVQLAHFAIKQAISEISGVEFDKNLVPSVVYGCPEIAWIGKREQDLEEGTYKKANILISALGKSHCDNCSDGFIKILSRDNKIIGAHIVSKEASSLIQEITIAMQNNIAIEDLKKVCFAHPTYSEGIFDCLFKL